MKSFSKVLVCALIGASALAFSAARASAAIVCSEHECWHAHEAYEYPPDAHVVVHPDDWHWTEHEHFAWREHPGRGYWHGDAWREF